LGTAPKEWDLGFVSNGIKQKNVRKNDCRILPSSQKETIHGTDTAFLSVQEKGITTTKNTHDEHKQEQQQEFVYDTINSLVREKSLVQQVQKSSTLEETLISSQETLIPSLQPNENKVVLELQKPRHDENCNDDPNHDDEDVNHLRSWGNQKSMYYDGGIRYTIITSSTSQGQQQER
jgi:hypothetical protein